MTLVQIAGGFVLGFIVGIGASLLYLRWKMRRQLGELEDQMGQMMDMTDNMDELVPEPEEGPEEEPEE
jgi:hypothetical protein